MTNAVTVALDRRATHLLSAEGSGFGRRVADRVESGQRPRFGIYQLSTPPQGEQR